VRMRWCLSLRSTATVVDDWCPEGGLRILRKCRQAMAPGGRVLIAEMVLRPGNTPFCPGRRGRHGHQHADGALERREQAGAARRT
jgi:hypothetical protein